MYNLVLSETLHKIVPEIFFLLRRRFHTSSEHKKIFLKEQFGVEAEIRVDTFIVNGPNNLLFYPLCLPKEIINDSRHVLFKINGRIFHDKFVSI